MRRRACRALYPLAVLALVAVGAGYLHLNRTVVVDNPSLGILKYRYKWGRPHELAADTNRDGRDDFLASYDGFSDFGGSPGREHWEDRNHDGVFDVHVVYRAGEVARVRVDGDHDGVFEMSAWGAEGAALIAASAPSPADEE